MSRLIVIAGLPGSGKTTLARKLETALPAFRFSADEWMESLGINLHSEIDRARVEELQWTSALRLLRLGNIVIVEWGTWGRSERDRLRLEAKAVGAAVELHYLSAPLEELFRRIQMRGMEDPPITWGEVRSWGTAFEIPTPEELSLFDSPILNVEELDLFP